MHLDRASIVYGIMILACAAGVWGVVSMGDRLKAPEDLAGQWKLADTVGPTTQPAMGMIVDQSGKFLQIAFDNGRRLHLHMTDQQMRQDPDGTWNYQVALVGEPWRLNVKGTEGSDQAEVRLTGPDAQISGIWSAQRMARQFPSDISKTAGGH